MWNLGYVCGLILLSASSSTGHVQLVYLNGTHIPIRKTTLCFADPYNVICKNGWFAPIQNTFGFKDPDRTKTCTNQVSPYPRQCCVINSTDCAFTSIKDFNQLRDTCSGKMKCVGQPAAQHAVWSSHPQMEERCPAQERLTSSAIATTQYVTTEYACIPLPSRQKICSSSSQSGKGLFLVSPDYPDYQPESAGYKCSCHVSVSGNTKLTVNALDLRLCDSKDGCGRSLTLGNNVITDTNMVERDASFFGFTGLKQIYSDPLNGYMNITLQKVGPKDSLHIWLYLYAEGSTITSVCDKETAITTTSTTTRTSTTRTTARTSTTSTTTRTSTTSTPTRTSTTSTPTTPLTTTATKSASSIKQSLTPSNSTPLKITKSTLTSTSKTTSPNVTDCDCPTEADRQQERKLYYIELASSALGGIIFTSIIWCIHRMCRKHEKDKDIELKSTENRYSRHFRNGPRSDHSVRPHDDTSKFGGERSRNIRHKTHHEVNQNQNRNRPPTSPYGKGKKPRTGPSFGKDRRQVAKDGHISNLKKARREQDDNPREVLSRQRRQSNKTDDTGRQENLGNRVVGGREYLPNQRRQFQGTYEADNKSNPANNAHSQGRRNNRVSSVHDQETSPTQSRFSNDTHEAVHQGNTFRSSNVHGRDSLPNHEEHGYSAYDVYGRANRGYDHEVQPNHWGSNNYTYEHGYHDNGVRNAHIRDWLPIQERQGYIRDREDSLGGSGVYAREVLSGQRRNSYNSDISVDYSI